MKRRALLGEQCFLWSMDALMITAVFVLIIIGMQDMVMTNDVSQVIQPYK